MENQKKDRSGLKTSLKRGGYIIAVTIIAIALVILLNLLVGQIPSSYTEIDISDTRIYSVSDTSKEYLADLNEDVEIIILSEDDGMDERIFKFIDKYAVLSDHLTVKTIDPTVNPSALSEYEAEQYNVVVRNVATGKQRVLTATELIQYDTSSYYYTGTYTASAFDCDGQLTSAVDYVTSENSYKIYTMTGHGESDLAATLTSAITKANLTLETTAVNLMSDGGVPEDCTVLICNAPTGDLSADELEMLETYMSGGGQVMYIMASEDQVLNNWNTLLSAYGLEAVDEFVGDMENYYQYYSTAYIFFPTLSSTSSITSGLAENSILNGDSRGILAAETAPEGVTVDMFLTTSASGFAESEPNTLTTIGLGAAATSETDSSQLIVFSSAGLFLESLLTNYASLSNGDMFINALTSGLADIANISIDAKSLTVSTNTVANPGLWGILFIAIIPLVILIGGLIFWIRRRRQ